MTSTWVHRGRAWRFGDDISVEAISPLRYMLSPRGRGRACLRSVDRAFADSDKKGDLLIAGRMFGHGPGHDHAVLALLESGIAGVVAVSFAPQFYRHCVGHGLLVAAGAPQQLLDQELGTIEVDFLGGTVRDLDDDQVWSVSVPSGPAHDVVAAGGLLPYLRGCLPGTHA